MSNWTFLNLHRASVVNPALVDPRYFSTPAEGFNGLFRFRLDCGMVRCIASDGTGEDGPQWKWQHVSVSIEGDKRPPKWKTMCQVKDLFWEPEDWVVQFHPAHSDYVNHHPGCLHLWRPLAEKMPTPHWIMVGPKTKGRG